MKTYDKMTRWRALDGLLSQGCPFSQYEIFMSYQRNRDLRIFNVSAAEFDRYNEKLKNEKLMLYRASFRKDMDIFKKVLVRNNLSDMLLVERGASPKQFDDGPDLRTKKYCYREKGFSIIPYLSSEMSDWEYRSLSSSVEKLRSVLTDNTFNEVRFAIRSRIEADYGKGMNCVEYEDNRRLKGREYRPVIYEAIEKKNILHLKYRDFSGTGHQFTFHPYLLKQYNERWFSFGYCPETDNIYFNIPLDRLESYPQVVGQYEEDRPADYLSYFSEIVGVTRQEVAKEHIVIGIHDINTWGRVTTKPLVSQNWDRERGFDKEKNYGRIWLDVRPNNELYSKILSWGRNVTIESPSSVREEMVSLLAELLSGYEADK